MRKRLLPRLADLRAAVAGTGSAPAGPATEPAGPEPAGPPGSRPATATVARSPAARRRGRDRRARGLRGPLAPPDSPLARTRGDRFGDLVLDAVERLEARWERELATVEFAVEPVPPPPDPAALPGEEVLLARLHPGGAGRPARIVLYRRPVEARASNRQDLATLVHDLVVEQVAELLGLEPETVDPDYGQ